MEPWTYNNHVEDYLMANQLLNSAAIISHQGIMWAQSETFSTCCPPNELIQRHQFRSFNISRALQNTLKVGRQFNRCAAYSMRVYCLPTLTPPKLISTLIVPCYKGTSHHSPIY